MVWITGNPRSKECHREGNWGLKKNLMHVLIFNHLMALFTNFNYLPGIQLQIS